MKGAMMRDRTGRGLRLGLAACCCAALAACTAGAPKGPDAVVSTPGVGRPPPPSSVQAALSSEAFTPYAALGQSNNDGLAPGESDFALAVACMTAAGYPDSAGSGNVPIAISIGPTLSFAQPWGGWGYLGAAEAQQYGFRMQPGSALSELGIDVPPPTGSPPNPPAAEQAAIGKCATIMQDFDNAVQNGALAGIGTLSDDIANDVLRDAAVKDATRAWSACMAKNGYSFTQPQGVFGQELRAMYGGGPITPADTVSAAANQAQIATAVTDAGCTQSSDLAGIYFAVQASYEQQLVNANQQALTAAVRQYRAAYAKELARLQALLRTAKAQPFPAGQRPPAAPRPPADLEGRIMRIRTGLGLLICCCLICCTGLAACTAAAPKGPDTTVTTPSVGRPPAPVSAQAALSSEALTPYFGLGAATDDGLAPGETYAALHTACMNDAGYGQYADAVPYPVRANRGMAFAQAYGPWGYIGTADAAQYGFAVPTASDSLGSPTSPVGSLPAAAQAAAGKCANIIAEFNDAQFATSMAGIETMNDVISTDAVQDPEFKHALKAWSACMAQNGYTASDADTLALQELDALGLRAAPGSGSGSGAGPGPGSGPTAAQNQAQIAAAVTDAGCTLSSDLAGIYFAVQASYEQQVIDANQQALGAAVREYKANYAKELRDLPALLRTASATLDLPGPAGKPGAPGRPGKPGPTRS